ncbi:hypothetical protein TWF694_008721 [Orbilia ellipsospora]|uniref:Uncharacterized protein n=1 Tax=Orbilia ellipsospora TaxID=2528407 RepID=A0AAV9XDK9_9PEZI
MKQQSARFLGVENNKANPVQVEARHAGASAERLRQAGAERAEQSRAERNRKRIE